jgi:hypothetical protein
MKKIFLISLFSFILTESLYSSCRCACVNGQVQAICTSSIDLKPICSPRICPIQTPSIRPIQTPVLPPIGTSNCRKEQVYNDNTYRYEWKTVCQ